VIKKKKFPDRYRT